MSSSRSRGPDAGSHVRRRMVSPTRRVDEALQEDDRGPAMTSPKRFPRSKPRIFQKWLANLKRDKWKPSPGSRLCSDHFAESCFDRSGARTRLRGDAVHTLFAFPDDSQKVRLFALGSSRLVEKLPSRLTRASG
ncbi:hypothetical protein HPB52_021367 [Rhipicephalus sanguineus]|uniref:THAP-type domain-containing protein n=1 Tax=Rhipicephalus sanguineus TaxID=34632 RepID=A0A9D4PK70_RHISA|nr:hypothetical protein HPB52_021367 [Rhipicephalus sanguineus]